MKRRRYLLALIALTIAALLSADALAKTRNSSRSRGGKTNPVMHATTSDVNVKLGDANPNITKPIGGGTDLQALHDQAMHAGDGSRTAPTVDSSLLYDMQRAGDSNRLQRTSILNLSTNRLQGSP